ncbi:MAG: phage Gp37/Gp68 family protein [Azoarcus sp.]|jgi:protein gp37|nr:phage Gp37/Gp68 family protein [Azoarcus sp.]
MGANSKIAWCDHSFNPWIGCTKVSPACDNCYAESWAKRSGLVKWGPHAERRRTSASTWRQPFKWNAGAAEKRGIFYRVFCGSLCDVFDNAVPDDWRLELFDMIQKTPFLQWMLLTKRIGNVQDMLDEIGCNWIADKTWIGITVCNQEEADRDIPKLMRITATKRFLSIEPMLGAIDLQKFIDPWTCSSCGYHGSEDDSVGIEHDGEIFDSCPKCGSVYSWYRDYGFMFSECNRNNRIIDWVIVGSENGSKRRPIDNNCVANVLEQCRAENVPVFVKQLEINRKLIKDVSQFPEGLRIQEFPK